VLLYCMLMSSTATTSQQLPLPPFNLCIITTTPVRTRIHTCAAWPWCPSAFLPCPQLLRQEVPSLQAAGASEVLLRATRR
jgi:hypothetical protein